MGVKATTEKSGLEPVEILQLGTAIRTLAMIYEAANRMKYPINCGYDRGTNNVLSDAESDIIKEAIDEAMHRITGQTQTQRIAEQSKV